MIRHSHLQHRFVKYIPAHLEPGVLYLSLEYGTAVHSCCCGCGEKVVTPFTPTDWNMTFDGETISLCPSVGNWNFACRSHYVVKRGRVIEADPWSDEQIEAERRRDKAAKAYYYGTSEKPPEAKAAASTHPETRGFWPTILRWLSKLK